ncbi:hypothetical protein [Brevundimonas sp.]|uniref:hypothetical protein n=1 Tax=Brevundimonas sp. TaxID=1871086 RepID=UPI0035B09A16
MHEEQQVREGEPGFGREEDLEAARRAGRPAEADMDADPNAAAEDPITVSPDPDAEETP